MKKEKSIQKVVALFDTHIPYHVPLDPVFEFIHDFKPDKVILGGDLHDWGSVSTWLADQSRILDGGMIKQNYEELRNVLFNPLQVAAGHAEKIFLTGNHEYRLIQAASINPNGRGFWELENNIDFKSYNMKLIPVNLPYRLNSNLIFIHGIFTNLYHARKTVESYHISVLYGHCHTFQSFTMVSPIDNEQFFTGQAIGCLCHLNPTFMKNRPNAWVNGFAYGYTGDRDSFQYIPAVVVRNQFWAEGRKYK